MALSLQRYNRDKDNLRFDSLLIERCRKERERSMLIVIKKINHLPENLIFEILSWLPVKDLLQYKSVSKSWYAIISSPNFISKHLKNYYYNNDDWRGCLLVHRFVTNAASDLLELFVDETPQVLADVVLSGITDYTPHIYGPCDGLYYVYLFDEPVRALWNPVTNEFEHLPNLISKPDLPAIFTPICVDDYGFGLDPDTGDYKVVVIQGYCRTTDDDSDTEHPNSVFVYSLRTNSWRYCGDLSKAYFLKQNTCYMYVNGCCYWIGSYKDTFEVIISFDFANDAYKEINVPDYAQPSSKCLGIYDDFPAILALQENKFLDTWTLNDEGSWIKKLTAGPFPDLYDPVGQWKDNMLILESKHNVLALFDPGTQEVKDLGFSYGPSCAGVYTYMESLVSIKMIKGVGAP